MSSELASLAPSASARVIGRRVWAVIEKEWSEARRSKMIVWSMILIPVFLVLMVLGTDYFMLRLQASGADTDSDELPIPEDLSHLAPFDAFLIQMNEQYMFYLFLIPMMMPVYMAAHSIIGEKQTNTLEPLLATPISTWELLAAKTVAAVVPAVIVTWIAYGMLLLGLRFVAPPVVYSYSARSVWVLAMLLLSPLMAILSVLCGVIVSSRMNDARAAQQVTGIFVVPIMGVSLVVLAGWIFVSVPIVLYTVLGTLLVDLVVLFFAVQLFQRETILTRWK